MNGGIDRDDPDFIAIPCDQDDIDLVLEHVVDLFKGSNSLIILHDCASGQEIKNCTSEVVKLGFSARHYGLSTIVVTQQFTSVEKPYRENISNLVTVHTPSRNDTKTIVNDYLNGVDKAETDLIAKQLKDHKYARLEIILRHPYGHVVVLP